ncbi:MAG: hypothetical protein IKE01_05380 [Clostridia bacterium]|nr:hypothetical protein [Clostridia bacterium]
MNNSFYPFYKIHHPSYFRRNYYPNNSYPNNTSNNLNVENEDLKLESDDTLKEKEVQSKKEKTRSSISINLDKPILEFRGFKLYYDDMLILALIYFLYLENINDTLLYLALFALLFF